MMTNVQHTTFIDPVRGAESGASLPAHERKASTRPRDHK